MDRKLSLPLKVDKWDSGFFNVKISRLNISGKKPDKSLTRKMHELIKLAIKAWSLYEKMGFKVVGTDKVFYKRMI